MGLNLRYDDDYSDAEMSLRDGECDTWQEQAGLFFRFLLAQGFILSEHDLATYFYDQGNEMKNLRANHQTTPPYNPTTQEILEAIRDAGVGVCQQEPEFTPNYQCGSSSHKSRDTRK
jgi:hypothetical protein